jgi:hypothetical protein
VLDKPEVAVLPSCRSVAKALHKHHTRVSAALESRLTHLYSQLWEPEHSKRSPLCSGAALRH